MATTYGLEVFQLRYLCMQLDPQNKLLSKSTSVIPKATSKVNIMVKTLALGCFFFQVTKHMHTHASVYKHIITQNNYDFLGCI